MQVTVESSPRFTAGSDYRAGLLLRPRAGSLEMLFRPFLDLFDRQSCRMQMVSPSALDFKQICQRRTTRQSASTFHEGDGHGHPGIAGAFGDRSGVAGGPSCLTLVKGVRPFQDARFRQVRQMSNISEAPAIFDKNPSRERTRIQGAILSTQVPTKQRKPRSHALRGNAVPHALRRGRAFRTAVIEPQDVRDAERPGRHSHAERGNEVFVSSGLVDKMALNSCTAP